MPAKKKKAAAPKKDAAPAATREFPLRPTVAIETSLGSFTLEFLVDQAPVTASNYLRLFEANFYDGLHVHRIVEDFVVQLGCPHTRDPDSELRGQGAPEPGSSFVTACGDEVTRVAHPEDPDGGYLVPDEYDHPGCARTSNAKYWVSAANAGPRSTGSQFFVNIADNGEDLDWWTGEGEDASRHVVFARVVDGTATVDKMARAKCADEVPEKPIRVLTTAVTLPAPAAIDKILKPAPGPRIAHLLVAFGTAVSARTGAAALCADAATAKAYAGDLAKRLTPATFATAAFSRSDCATYASGGDCGPLPDAAAAGAGAAAARSLSPKKKKGAAAKATPVLDGAALAAAPEVGAFAVHESAAGFHVLLRTA